MRAPLRLRHHRAARRSRRAAQRRQRDGAGGPGARAAATGPAEGAALRDPRRVRVPRLATLLAVYLISLALGEAGRRRLPAVPGCPALLAAAAGQRAAHAAEGDADVRAVAVLGDGREGRADRHRLRHRFDPGGGRDVAEDLGRSSPAASSASSMMRHGDRPAARDRRSAIRRSWTARSSSSRGWASSWWSSICTPPATSASRSRKWIVARADRRDLLDRAAVCACASSGKTRTDAEQQASELLNDQDS